MKRGRVEHIVGDQKVLPNELRLIQERCGEVKQFVPADRRIDAYLAANHPCPVYNESEQLPTSIWALHILKFFLTSTENEWISLVDMYKQIYQRNLDYFLAPGLASDAFGDQVVRDRCEPFIDALAGLVQQEILLINRVKSAKVMPYLFALNDKTRLLADLKSLIDQDEKVISGRIVELGKIAACYPFICPFCDCQTYTTNYGDSGEARSAPSYNCEVCAFPFSDPVKIAEGQKAIQKKFDALREQIEALQRQLGNPPS